MKISSSILPLALSTALFASGQALAVTINIEDVSITNGAGFMVYTEIGGGLLQQNIDLPEPPLYATYLDNDATNVGDNIELGILDSAADYAGKFVPGLTTTMTGDFGGADQIVLSSLVQSDWAANGNALAEAYIAAALAFSSPIVPLPPIDIPALAALFVVSQDGAFRVSDPNVAYANLVDDVVTIGLEGLFNAAEILNGLVGQSVFVDEQVSEVVKVTYMGQTDYLYGFEATRTGLKAADCTNQDPDTCSYSGNYEVTLDVPTIPEPATLALLGLGIAGVGWSARRRNRG